MAEDENLDLPDLDKETEVEAEGDQIDAAAVGDPGRIQIFIFGQRPYPSRRACYG